MESPASREDAGNGGVVGPVTLYFQNESPGADKESNWLPAPTGDIQNKSPGGDKESNWLPAPNGDIYLVMRLYWPKTEAPSILPPGSGTWKPPAIMVAN
jgi:hypothetical protein